MLAQEFSLLEITNMFVLHGLSVDVEEWFHILDCDTSPQPIYWDCLEPRITYSLGRLLNFFSKHHVRATFFFLGWVAQRHPDLVKQVVEQGHEIGSHGYIHKMVSKQTPDDFARDLDTSLTAISRASGCDVRAYRAPGFSITPREFWAFEILASRGIYLDSSLFLGPHAHGGLSLKRNRPFELILPDGRRIVELPIVACSLLGWNLPFSGGGYLRLLPTPAIKLLFKIAERNGSAVAYIHSRDFDPNQPRMNLSPIRYFKYYVGLKAFPNKLEQLLKRFHFSTFGDVVMNSNLDKPLYIGSATSRMSDIELQLQ